jgi:dTDP-3-amino-3,4,6-trideoxy-alpha-D-glucose transaminase
VKLRHLDAWNLQRRNVASNYMNLLAEVEGITLLTVPKKMTPVWHLFVIQHENRDVLQEHLQLHGIGTQIHYPIPIHHSNAYEDELAQDTKLEVTEYLAGKILSLPMAPYVKELEIECICEVISNSY